MTNRETLLHQYGILLLTGFFLIGCTGTANVGRSRVPDQPTIQMSTSSTNFVTPANVHTKQEITPVPTSIFWNDYADSDQFGDQYIPRLSIEGVKNLPEEEIVRLLVDQWLEHYKTDCQDPYYQLETYSVGNIRLDTAQYGYEIVANIQYEILPMQPLTADYTGEAAPNGWYAFPGKFLPDGTEQLGAYFGVFREGDHYRLRMLIGWGV